MTCKEEMEKFNTEARNLIDQKRFDVLKVFLVNYGQNLVDYGTKLDLLYAENERLKAIVNLIELKDDRDRLAKRVAELEADADGKNASDGSLMR